MVNSSGRYLAADPVSLPGECRQVVVDAAAPGGRIWNFTVSADDQQGATLTAVPQMIGFLPWQGIDVGLNRRSPVSWDLYQRHRTFPYTGTLSLVTYTPGPPAPDADDVLLEDFREFGLALE